MPPLDNLFKNPGIKTIDESKYKRKKKLPHSLY